MMSIEQLARLAYEIHLKTTRPEARGLTVQPWERLETLYKAAWIAVVQALRAEIAKH